MGITYPRQGNPSVSVTGGGTDVGLNAAAYGTAAEWTAANPVLAKGELGYETDTYIHKVGDGSTAWASLSASGSGTYLSKSSNLSDLTSASTARTSLGLGASAVMSTAQIAADSALTGTFGQLWTSPTASTTLTGTLAVWVITAVDCTAGPAANSVTAGVAVCAKKADTSTNNLVVSRAGSDLIYGTGSGATSKTLSLAGEAVEFVSNGVDKWTIRSSDTPSGVLATTYAKRPASGVAGYDSLTAVALRNFRLALADRDTNPCDLMHIGDSITSGYKATTIAKRWTSVLRDTLRTRFTQTATGGVGYISANPNAGSSTTFSDNPVAVSGGAFQSQNFGLDTAGRTMTAAGHTVTVTFTGTGLDFSYAVFSGGGTFSWAVDGGAATNINTNGSSDFTTVSRAIRSLSVGSHSVVFAYVSGGTVYWTGAAAYNGDESKGIRSWTMGQPGSATSLWWNVAKNQWWDLVGDLVSPDLVTIELGVNDYGGASPVAVATFKSNVQAIISKIKTNSSGYVPSFVLLPVPAVTPQGSVLATWADYVTAMYEIASADADSSVCVLDLQQRINPGSPGTAGGVLPDNTHPADAGNRLYAEVIAGFISPA